MAYYPIMVEVEDREVVVVGGGEVAARKVQGLVEAGARVRVVAPEVCERIARAVHQGAVEWVAKRFEPSDLAGAVLAVSAADSEEVNRAVAVAARDRGVLVNVVDRPQLCSFIVPSVLRRGRLVLAVSTSGASPAVAARLRRQLEEFIGPHWEEYLELLARVRGWVLKNVPAGSRREQLLKALADPALEAMVAQGQWAKLQQWLRDRLGEGFSLKTVGFEPGGGGWKR